MAGSKPDRGPVTNPYQQGRPNQKPSGLACGTPYQTLPRVAISCARGADQLGGFGLVVDPYTRPYQSRDLGQPPFYYTITNHYHLTC